MPCLDEEPLCVAWAWTDSSSKLGRSSFFVIFRIKVQGKEEVCPGMGNNASATLDDHDVAQLAEANDCASDVFSLLPPVALHALQADRSVTVPPGARTAVCDCAVCVQQHLRGIANSFPGGKLRQTTAQSRLGRSSPAICAARASGLGWLVEGVSCSRSAPRQIDRYLPPCSLCVCLARSSDARRPLMRS